MSLPKPPKYPICHTCFFLKTITHRGMKWWANEFDIVTVLEHESVIPREC